MIDIMANGPARAASTWGAGPMVKTAREFEAVFAGELAKLMLECGETTGDFSGGHGEAMFRGIMAEEIGKQLAGRGTLGLAPSVIDQMIRMQEGGR